MIKNLFMTMLLLAFVMPAQAQNSKQTQGETIMFEAIKLPYKADIFEPAISKKTFDFHYGKHYKTYLDNLNALMKEKDVKASDLEGIIKESHNNIELLGVYNNAAQVYNHEFYFKNLQPISISLKQKIIEDFGSVEAFKEEWKKASLSQFGSGWVWLINKFGKLQIVRTSNADTPITNGDEPLLCIDVWEHAYYLDYQNKRGDYIDAFLNIVLN